MPKSRSVVSVKKHLIRNKKLEKDILSSEGEKNKKTSSLQLFSVSFNSQTSDVIDVVLLLRGEKCHDCDFKTTDSQCLRDHIDEKHDLQKIDSAEETQSKSEKVANETTGHLEKNDLRKTKAMAVDCVNETVNKKDQMCEQRSEQEIDHAEDQLFEEVCNPKSNEIIVHCHRRTSENEKSVQNEDPMESEMFVDKEESFESGKSKETNDLEEEDLGLYLSIEEDELAGGDDLDDVHNDDSDVSNTFEINQKCNILDDVESQRKQAELNTYLPFENEIQLKGLISFKGFACQSCCFRTTEGTLLEFHKRDEHHEKDDVRAIETVGGSESGETEQEDQMTVKNAKKSDFVMMAREAKACKMDENLDPKTIRKKREVSENEERNDKDGKETLSSFQKQKKHSKDNLKLSIRNNFGSESDESFSIVSPPKRFNSKSKKSFCREKNSKMAQRRSKDDFTKINLLALDDPLNTVDDFLTEINETFDPDLNEKSDASILAVDQEDGLTRNSGSEENAEEQVDASRVGEDLEARENYYEDTYESVRDSPVTLDQDDSQYVDSEQEHDDESEPCQDEDIQDGDDFRDPWDNDENGDQSDGQQHQDEELEQDNDFWDEPINPPAGGDPFLENLDRHFEIEKKNSKFDFGISFKIDDIRVNDKKKPAKKDRSKGSKSRGETLAGATGSKVNDKMSIKTPKLLLKRCAEPESISRAIIGRDVEKNHPSENIKIVSKEVIKNVDKDNIKINEVNDVSIGSFKTSDVRISSQVNVKNSSKENVKNTDRTVSKMDTQERFQNVNPTDKITFDEAARKAKLGPRLANNSRGVKSSLSVVDSFLAISAKKSRLHH